jgi:hypothetical protein
MPLTIDYIHSVIRTYTLTHTGMSGKGKGRGKARGSSGSSDDEDDRPGKRQKSDAKEKDKMARAQARCLERMGLDKFVENLVSHGYSREVATEMLVEELVRGNEWSELSDEDDDGSSSSSSSRVVYPCVYSKIPSLGTHKLEQHKEALEAAGSKHMHKATNTHKNEHMH